MNKMIVLQAVPSVRTVCPPCFIEGEWREVPDSVETIKFGVMPDLTARTISLGDVELEEVTLVAKPSGRMARRESDGATAPIWEIRHPDDW